MTKLASEWLGVVLSTVTDATVGELVDLGRLAEAQRFDAVLVNEGRGDALAASQAIAAATSRITVGTNIANIYFRHPFLCAATARTIADLSGGRLLLGLGMSHRAMLASLGIDMGNARDALSEYVAFVKNALAGTVTKGFLGLPVFVWVFFECFAPESLMATTISGVAEV